jgi:hypothetical protein
MVPEFDQGLTTGRRRWIFRPLLLGTPVAQLIYGSFSKKMCYILSSLMIPQRAVVDR